MLLCEKRPSEMGQDVNMSENHSFLWLTNYYSDKYKLEIEIIVH